MTKQECIARANADYRKEKDLAWDRYMGRLKNTVVAFFAGLGLGMLREFQALRDLASGIMTQDPFTVAKAYQSLKSALNWAKSVEKGNLSGALKNLARARVLAFAPAVKLAAIATLIIVGGGSVAYGIEMFNLKRSRDNKLDECENPSPLILDLDGDGVEADALTHFDHAGDGWRELSRWASADDGVLVWDRNNDGVINDGSELFGNNTALKSGNKAANGFAALADLDNNSDGKVDSSDAEWGSLRVMRWTDANNDGIMQESESRLVTLDSLGVKSLGTGYTESDHVDKSGNEHRQVGSYTKTDGTTAKMTDVWFVTSPGDTDLR